RAPASASARAGRGCEHGEQRLRRPAAMRVLALPLVAELGDGALLACRHEHRVEAEAGGAPRLEGDRALERAPAAQLAAVGRDRDELAHVAGAPVGDAGERRQDPLDVATLRPAGRLDAGPAAERVHLEARVLAEHPRILRPDAPPEPCLRPRVVDEGRAGLGRVLVRLEKLQLPAWQRGGELAALVLVARAQPRD